MNKYTNIAKFALHSKSILPTRTASFSGENGGFTPTVRSNNSVRRTQVSQKFPFRVIKAGRIIDRQHFFVFLTNKGGYRKNGQGVVLTKKSEDLCKSSKPSIADFLDGKDVTLSGKATRAEA